MTELDVNTPKGETAKMQEKRAHELLVQRYPCDIIPTYPDKKAKIDAIFSYSGELDVIAETKSREYFNRQKKTLFTEKKLFDVGSWLITFDKIERGKYLSEILTCVYIGLLYLVSEDKLFVWKIARFGEWCCDFDTRKTKTKETTNGGEAYRENAFLRTSDIVCKVDGKFNSYSEYKNR